MGKWIERLNTVKVANDGPDKTAKSPLLSVLAVPVPASTELLKGAATLPSSVGDAWSDTEIARFIERRARLVRWGWLEVEAENLAERLLHRDRDIDERVSCVDCRNYRAGICANHKTAEVGGRDVGRRFAEMLQRCRGFRLVEGE